MKPAKWLQRFMSRYIINYALRFLLILLLITIGSLTFNNRTVLAAPSITSYPAPFPQGQVAVPYSATLTVTGYTGTLTWGSPINLPAGLTLTPSGATAVITGTPTTAATYYFSITVTDSGPPITSTTFSSPIVINPTPFTITTDSVSQGKEGASYSTTLSVSGGTSPYSWNITGGSLPSGISITSSTGSILGTIGRGTAGTYNFTVTATDSSSPQRSATKSFSLFIEKGTFQAYVTVGAGLKAGSTKVSIDGKTAGTLKGGESLTLNFDLGIARSVSVDPIVAHPTDSGIRFKAVNESMTISESQTNIEFPYNAEYLVTIKTEPSLNIQAKGSGWYRNNDTVNASTNTEVEGNTGIKYRFAYWLLAGDKMVTSENVTFTVDSPITITAKYDTYYKLTTESLYGQVEGAGWYKAGSQARWLVVNDKVPMPGLIGLFQGKYKASNASGTETMDAPKTVTVFWEPDYTMAYILIPLAILLVIAGIVGLYFLLRRQPSLQPQQPMGPPVMPYPPLYMSPPPPPPRPIPQQHTTVVMIGDKGNEPKQLPSSTKEQLMEKFGELLEKYEAEIKTSLGPVDTTKALPKPGPVPMGKMIPGPQPSMEQPIPPPIVDAEFTQTEVEPQAESDQPCRYTGKKLLRTVTTSWRQLESDTISLPIIDKEETKEVSGLLVVWARDIYHEWEIISCYLPLNHKEKHKGDTQIVYSLLNTVIEKKTYGATDKITPPTPHFTDGMPQMEIPEDQITLADELPSETIK